jgi:hypothetical protein
VAACIVASIAGAPDPVPAVRGGLCVAEAGGSKGIAMANNLSEVLADPATGKPKVRVGCGQPVPADAAGGSYKAARLRHPQASSAAVPLEREAAG